MTTTTLSSRIGNRWNTLKYLDNDSKIDLITMLTQSLRVSSEKKHLSASKYYGIWGDDGMTAEEFVNALRNERKFKQDIVELWNNKAGTPCDDNFDLLIACTAIANEMICVTDNTKDFYRFLNINLENWINR